ncbi:hypothetical protein KQX54_017226 [Cotesia glomerata]|uniref:Uncharacterized protein n=1 Tax=Cotesia glomerata TaxID=32391 RepID=A0AAV7IFH5_COTGL|nr:hypothetical protein KQX54_017226 [Cotesia glomerata]
MPPIVSVGWTRVRGPESSSAPGVWSFDPPPRCDWYLEPLIPRTSHQKILVRPQRGTGDSSSSEYRDTDSYLPLPMAMAREASRCRFNMATYCYPTSKGSEAVGNVCKLPEPEDASTNQILGSSNHPSFSPSPTLSSRSLDSPNFRLRHFPWKFE